MNSDMKTFRKNLECMVDARICVSDFNVQVVLVGLPGTGKVTALKQVFGGRDDCVVWTSGKDFNSMEELKSRLVSAEKTGKQKKHFVLIDECDRAKMQEIENGMEALSKKDVCLVFNCQELRDLPMSIVVKCEILESNPTNAVKQFYLDLLQERAQKSKLGQPDKSGPMRNGKKSIG
jgi:replication-associated recombination protein RarA